MDSPVEAVEPVQNVAVDDGLHCYHHQHDSECGGYHGVCDESDDGDDCVHCECCCTCLGCEYGPRDGMLLYPNGAPWATEEDLRG